MNKLRYRLVFNKARGMLMAVQEIARSHGKGPGETAAPAGVAQAWGPPGLRPLALLLAGAFGGALVSGAALAQIVADPNAPGRERPTVLEAANGVLQVNVQTPSAAGVSRNVYSQFDVPKSGAILNNSRTDVQTQLGGWVQANPWMKTGTARVILNEVNSSNPSRLQGFIEVAGQRAETVIANPAGIVVDGGGFINVSRATLTTGRPLMNDGQLTGFDVQRGRVTVEGAGLNASQTDYTALIARSVQINAGLWAPRLGVVTGVNQVGYAEVPGVTPQAADGAAATEEAPRYAIDVAQLGGMYANHIWLVGTESGVGVRNAGEIGAAAGDLVVSSSGRLENRGSMEAAGRLQATAQAIDNSGSLRASGDLELKAQELRNAGQLATHGEARIAVAGTLDNSAGAIEAGRVEIGAAALRNREGSIVQTGAMALALRAQQLTNNEGTLGQAAAAATPALPDAGTAPVATPEADTQTPAQPPAGTAPQPETGSDAVPVPVPAPARPAGVLAAELIDNDGGLIAASGGVQADSASFASRGGKAHLERLEVTGPLFDNAGGTLDVRGALTAAADSFVNRDGKVTVGGTAAIGAAAVDNGGGLLQARNLMLRAGELDNSGGTLRHTGAAPVTLTVDGELRHDKGSIDSAATLALRAGSISGAGGTLNVTGDLDLASGATSAAGASWRIGGDARIDAGALDASGGSISAGGDMTLDAAGIDNTGGKIVAGGAASMRITGKLDNTRGLLQSAGALTVTADGALVNSAGTVETLGQRAALQLQAAQLDNTDGKVVNAGVGGTGIRAAGIVTSGLIGGNGKVDIVAGEFANNGGGRVIAAADMALSVSGLLANHGTIATASGSKGALAVDAGRIDNDGGKLQADADARIAARAELSNIGGAIAAAGLQLDAGAAIDNGKGEILAERLAVRGAAIGNAGGRIVASGLDAALVQATGAIDNGGVIGARGALTLDAQVLDNRAGAEIATEGALDLAIATRLANAGKIGSSGALTFESRGATLENSGAILAGAAARLDLDRIDNRGGSIATVEGAGLALAANAFDNGGGKLISGAAAELDIGTHIDNTGGVVQAGGALRIDAGAELRNAAGVLEALGGQATLDLKAGAIDNGNGRIVNVGSGATTIDAGSIASSGLIAGNGALALAARTLQSSGEVRSGAAMTLDVRERLDNSGAVSAAASLRMEQGDATVRNSGTLVAGADIVLSAADIDNSGGKIATARDSGADLALRAKRIANDGGAIMADGSATLAATGDFANARGLVQARQDLAIDAGGALDNTGGTIETLSADSTLRLGAAALANGKGHIVNTGSADTAIDVAGTLDNGDGELAGNGKLDVRAQTLSSSADGVIAAGAALALDVDGAIDNAGAISSRAALDLQSASLKNSGTVVAGAGATIRTGQLDNGGGRIATAAGSGASLAITADSLANRDGRIHAEGALALSVEGAIDNTKGTLQGASKVEVTAGATLANDGGRVEASGAAATLDVSAGAIDNGSGQIVNVGAGDARIQAAGDIASNGVIAGNGKLVLAAQQLVNGKDGTLSSGAAMELQASRRLDNAGAISSAGAFTLDQAAASVANSGKLNAGGNVLLRADAIANDGGQIATANGAAIALGSANALSNRGGTIATAGDATLRAGGALDNTGGGTIETSGAASTLALDAASVANSGRIVNSGAGNTTIAGRAGIANDGTIGGNGALLLGATTLRNGASGAIVAGSALELALSQSLENAGGSISSGGTLRFDQAGATFTNSGSIGAGGALDIRAAAIRNNGGGQLYTAAGSGAAVNLQTGELNNIGGKVAADGRLDIAVQGAVHNDGGTLHGARGLALNAGQALANGSGVIEAAGGVLDLRAASIASSGRIVNGGSGDINVTSASDIVNAGAIAGNGGLAITSQVLHNYAGGQIGAGRELVLGVGRDLANAGSISSAGALTFEQAGASFTNSGQVDAGGRASFHAAWFNNDGGRITTVKGSGADINVTAPGLSNRGGHILADGRATFALNGALDNRGGTLQAGSGLAVNANGLLSNDAGTIEATGANAGLSIDAAAIDNGGGRIANLGTGETRLASQGAILNNGAIDAAANLVLSGQELQNDAAGRIGSKGSMTLAINRQWTNRGSVNSDGALIFDQAGATFVNSGQVLAGGNVLINAWQVDNSGGRLGTGNGSGADLRLITQSLVNRGGSIAADRDLNITTHAMNGMGRLFGGRDLALSMDGDYVHGESADQFQANRDLSLSVTGNITNKTAFQAAGKLTLSGQNITNQANATIEARDVALRAVGNLDNAGEIQGENTLDISAGYVRNTAGIVGGNVTLSAWDLDNTGAAALVGATEALRLGVGGTLNNTAGATLYSSGSMGIGGNGGGETIVVNNHSSTIEAGGDLTITAGTLKNVRDNVQIVKVQTQDTTTTMLPPSWYKNGRNYGYYDEKSSNYTPREMYFVHPDDILEETPLITPDGFTVVRAVIRTHADDSAFFVARSAEYVAYGTQQRILNEDGTRVIYYYEKSTMANPDQEGSRANILDGQDGVKSWKEEVALSSAYGRCSTNCYRLVTQPEYDNPQTTILRHTLKALEKEHNKLENRRDARHVVVEDRLADGAGPLSQILSSGNMTLTTSSSLDNRYGDIKARGRLEMLGLGIRHNEGATLYRTHQFTGTWYTDAGDKPRYEHPSISERLGEVRGTIHGELGVTITGRSFTNVDVTAGTVRNIRDSVRVIGSGQSGAGSAGANAAAGTGGGAVSGNVDGKWKGNPLLAGAQSAGAGNNLAANGQSDASGVQNASTAGGAADGSGVSSNGQLTVVGQAGAGQVGAGDVRSTLGAAGQGATNVQGGTIGEARKVAPGGLFIQNPNASGDYLFETRPQFAKQDQWTSSDYLLDQVAIDPAMTHKRLGDGFYEQRLVREQLSQLAGRTTFMGASDDSIYKELLTNGVSAAREFDLRPGIALSAEQVARLTSDIVWMVSETVQLPDGRIETVLVPKVYAATLGKEALRPGGALVTGGSVTINVTESIVNTGGLIDGGNGRTLLVAGQDIVNRGGSIAGASVSLDAERDIRNESLTVKESWATAQNGGSHTQLSNQGTITATGALTIEAGRNLTDLAGKLTAGSAVITAGNEIRFDTVKTGSTYQSQIGDARQNDSSVTHQLSQVNIGGDLTMKAGGDLNLTGTQVAIGTNGKGSGFIAAGGAVNIAAVRNEANSSLHTDPSSKSYDKQVFQNETVVGSAISATGNLKVDAGTGGAGSANIVASSLSAGEALRVSAADDVNVVSAQERHLSDTASTRSSGGALRKKTTQQADYVESSQAIASSLSGKTIDISAGNDINVRGSAIAGEGDVDLAAGGSVNIAAATSTLTEKHHKEVKESGFLSGGGFGISFGERTTTTDQERDAATQSGQSRSMVGSIGGNLNISAGNAVEVSGSDLHAGRDMTVEGKSVTIDVGRDDVRDKFEQSTVQDGLTLAVGGSVVGALQTMQTMKDAASQSKDGRIQALAAATAALAAKNTANDIAQNGLNVSVSLTAGHSESHTSTTSQNLTNVGSTLKAGNDITIRATGAGADSNIDIVGSDVNAGGNIKLKADNEVNLIAAQDTESQHTDSRSMSASMGGGATIGTNGPPAIGFTASASVGKGKEDGKGTTQLNSHVAAGNQLAIESGGDTNIKGAVVSGKQVVADVGGDLSIESLQDTATFDSKNQSLGVSGTFGAGASVSGSFSDSKLKSDYASVQEQSGIRAGADGFQLVVKGNTDLKGAVISSSQEAIDAGKNSLTTDTLTVSDIENHADYKGHSVGLSGGIGSKSDSRDAAPDTSGVAGDSWKLMQTGGTGMNAPIAVGAKGSDSSTTQSGISGGLVTITNGQQQQELTGKSAEQVLADLNRDVSNEKDTSGRLENDFDKASIQAGFEIVGAFSGQVSTFLADKARDIDRARAEAEQADANADRLIAEANGLPEGEERSRKLAVADDYLAKAVSARVNANSMEEQWGPGGTYRQIISAVTAAASGNVSGATNEFVQQSVVNWVQANAAGSIKQLAEDYGIAEGSPAHVALHAVSACAGAAAADSSCGTGALAAASATLASSILATQDAESLSNEQKEARAELVKTLIVGAAVVASAQAEAANTAALIELENNSNVRKIVDDAINNAKKFVSKNGKEGLEEVSNLLSKLEVKTLKDKREIIEKFLDDAAQKGGLSESQIAALGILYAANDVLFPVSALDLLPGAGKAIAKTGTLIKQGLRAEKAAEIATAASVAEKTVGSTKAAIAVSSGEKGNWSKILNKPEPNKVYNVDNRYLYQTDELGRVNRVEGSLDLQTFDRNKYQQCAAGKCGANGDEGGHLIASIFSGPGEKLNLVPMNGNLNKGEWKKIENAWADALNENKSVQVDIRPIYGDSTKRPEKFEIVYKIDGGRSEVIVLKNTPGGV